MKREIIVDGSGAFIVVEWCPVLVGRVITNKSLWRQLVEWWTQ